MNIIDIAIIAVIAVSALYGLYRGFVSGVLSVAALIGSAALAFATCGQLAAWLQGNRTLVDTLLYYTDAGSRIGDLEMSLMTVSQATENVLAQVLSQAKLPAAFETAFVNALSSAPAGMTLSSLLSNTIVSVTLSILSFLICFLLAYIVLTLLIHMICYVFELPVLRHLDALAGGLFGLVRGALLVFIFFALVPIVLAVAPIEQLQTLIDGSRLAPMFDSGIILSILRSGG